jgi:molybdopterin/thiamine biosynthesis adenylyltransferase
MAKSKNKLITNSVTGLFKAFYASQNDIGSRIPELYPLRNKTIAVFGVGCLGAQSALEFAKAGVKCLRLVDFDRVDPATSVRWPLGFSVAGSSKVEALSKFISENFPYTKCEIFNHKLGMIRELSEKVIPSELEVVEKILHECDLVYDSIAEIGVQHFLSAYSWSKKIIYIGVCGTHGGWGGKVFRLRPWKNTGCFFCYRTKCETGEVEEPPSAPEKIGLVQPTGCADPTFTAAGFDMLITALTGVRMAVSTLCEGHSNAYPSMNDDIIHIHLRDNAGVLILPVFKSYRNSPIPTCVNCHGKPENGTSCLAL